MAPRSESVVATRPLAARDLDEIVRIDAALTGEEKRAYWKGILRAFLGQAGRPRTFGFGADANGGLAGYLFGEVRAVEFGSEPCGWVFAIGVDGVHQRRGVGAALLQEACRRFRRAGVTTVRTMVRRNNVPFLSFFRSQRFVGGPFVQLELNLLEDQ